MEITELYQLFKDHSTISTDTRNIKQGSIFFALKGDNFNGNEFSEQALELGAAYSIIDEPKYQTTEYHILVDNVLESLQKLATYHRKKLNIPVIGITGTNGKTTTKELIHSVLSQKFHCYATKGNLNNHIGVPLSVLEINKSHHIAIIEMGANHIGEIADLCKISQPTTGLITNIGKAHLEGFGSIEGVKKAKSELYSYLSHHDQPVFINGDNQILVDLVEGCFQITYGKAEKNQIIGKIEANEEQLSISWKKLNFFGFTLPISTNLVGEYNFENILAAICIGNYFELTPDEIATGITSYMPSNNRSQFLKKGTNGIILDAYNANPVSMKAALDNLLSNPCPNKLAIIGGMKELGKYSNEEHQAIVDFIMENSLAAFLVGTEFEKVNVGSLPTFTTTEQLSQYIRKKHLKESIILIKGSRSIGLEKIVDAI